MPFSKLATVDLEKGLVMDEVKEEEGTFHTESDLFRFGNYYVTQVEGPDDTFVVLNSINRNETNFLDKHAVKYIVQAFSTN